jgi:hypothetical protein
MMHWVTEATFHKPEDAASLKQRLEAAGIKTHIQDERRRQKFWFLADPLAGVHLQVDRSDYETARRLLEQWDDGEGALRDAVHCPVCRSSRIEFPQFTRKFVSPSIYAVLCALHLFDRKFYCQDCHYTWPARTRGETPTDILGWPIKGKGAAAAEQKQAG